MLDLNVKAIRMFNPKAFFAGDIPSEPEVDELNALMDLRTCFRCVSTTKINVETADEVIE
jgi:hypothetical protein